MRPRATNRRPVVEALLLTVRTLLRRPAVLRRLRDDPDHLHDFFRESLAVLMDVVVSHHDESIPSHTSARLRENERLAIRGLLPKSIDPGLVYEQLLSLSPTFDPLTDEFNLVIALGSARKRLGSYSTPDCLIDVLLRTALDPILAPGLRICDPACGCGRLLIAAAMRLAHSLRLTFREVALSCVFGVDRDPLAVDLCRLALWRACSDRDLPCSVFDNAIRCGNSLIGVMDQPEGDPDRWTARHLGNAPSNVLKRRHRFFHWPCEFSDGFDVVLCNPPWEQVKHQDRDQAVEESRFLRFSGRYPLSARGDLNYYGPFIETCRRIVRPQGRIGLIVPSGIATDDHMKSLFEVLTRDDLVSWYDFHNRRRLFPEVQGNIKFGLMTLARGTRPHIEVASQLSHPCELDSPDRIYTLNTDTIARINPNTLHFPTFTSSRDAALVEKIYQRFPILIREGTVVENPWNVRPWTMFHMTKDAPLFRREESLRYEGARLQGNVFRKGKQKYLPLWEAKLIAPYCCRAATFADVPEDVRFRTHARTRSLESPDEPVLPRYWIAEEIVESRTGGACWHLGFRNAISAVADSRSLVAAIVPRVGVGNSLPLLSGLDAPDACLLLALLNSFVLDYVLRQKASGGNLNFHVLKQLPVPAPSLFEEVCPWSQKETLGSWFRKRVLKLAYDECELRSFARECGCPNEPYHIDNVERFQIRCELDAACFHLYGLSRDEVEHVLQTFEVLRRKEARDGREFRSAEMILKIYDCLGES